MRRNHRLPQEIVPFVEDRFSCGGAGRRACFGKSSGGCGTAWHGMHHADFFYLALDVLQRFEWSISERRANWLRVRALSK